MDDVWFGPGFTRRDFDAFLEALALLAKPQPLLAVSCGRGEAARLVAASRALFTLFGVTSSEALSNRLLASNDPGSKRLAALARALPVGGAPRLERLRFHLGAAGEIMTFLCRRVAATEDRPPLFIAAALGVKGAEAAPPEDREAAAPDARTTTGIPAEEWRPAPGAATPMTVQAIMSTLRARWPANRAVRFLWQTDADTVCTNVTPPLAEVVGMANADLVGRNLLDLAPTLDPSGRLAEALAGRRTWSGLDVAWPMTDTPAAVSVGLGAVPAFDRDKAFEGYRGYGVIHLDRLVSRDPIRLTPHPETSSRREKDADNILPFPGGQKALSPDDQLAFDALGLELRDQVGIQLEDASVEAVAVPPPPPEPTPPVSDRNEAAAATPEAPSEQREAFAPAPPGIEESPAATAPPATDAATRAALAARNGLAVMDRLTVGLLVSRDEVPIFANRFLLDLLGFADEEALWRAGGMTHLFGGVPGNVTGSEAVGLRAADGSIIASNARMQRIQWDGEPAILLTLQQIPEAAGSQLEAARQTESRHQEERERFAVERVRLEAARERDEGDLRELRAILETAIDGIAIIDGSCNVVSINRSAEALFGRDRATVVGKPFLDLFASHNQDLAADYLEGLKSNATKSLLNDGRAILVKAHQGGSIPVFMTLGRLGTCAGTPSGEASGSGGFCALFRDLTHWKKVEGELEAAKVAAERASALKTDFLAKVSHEIRTPLNAIIGFAEVIVEERFGPVGNERYKDYLRDIHASGTHVMSLVNDLLDLSKIEAGRMELAEEEIDANKVIGECVAMMQPQASRERVIMRMSLASGLPRIRADERSLRQIVLNLLSNAVKFNEPGGQVIVATTLTEARQVVIRIRDTGPGMSEADILVALEPFRQLSARPTAGGTGLGLPLTKALVEANQASFTIRSKVDQGTLVEVAFPQARVLAD